jgi:hypothetical protein
MASFVGHALFSRAWRAPRLRGLRHRSVRAGSPCAAGAARGVAARPGGSFRRRLTPGHTAVARHPASRRRARTPSSPTPAAPRPAPRARGSGRRSFSYTSRGGAPAEPPTRDGGRGRRRPRASGVARAGATMRDAARARGGPGKGGEETSRRTARIASRPRPQRKPRFRAESTVLPAWPARQAERWFG